VANTWAKANKTFVTSLRHERYLAATRAIESSTATFTDWLSQAIVGSDRSISAVMLFNNNGTPLSSARAQDRDLDFTDGVPLLVRLPRFGLDVFLRVDSEKDRARVIGRVTDLGDLGSVIPR